MATRRVWSEPSKRGIEELQVCWRSFWANYGHGGSRETLIQARVLKGPSLFSGKGQSDTLPYLPFGKDCAILGLVGMELDPC